MSTSIIDLCEDLHPADLLDDIEETLADRALEVVSLCKGIWQDGKWELLEEACQEAEELWRRHGEQTGRAASLLWLADLHWRNARSDGAIRYAVKAIDHVPDEPPPAYSTVKAVANYLLSLWRKLMDRQQIGYAVGQKLRVFGTDDTIKAFTLRGLNAKLQIGAAPLLPAGAIYYMLPVEEQLAPPDMDIRPTDYFLVCGSAPREDCDGFMGLSRHRENNAMVLGAFQRDSQGRVYEKAFQPARFVGEPEANFVPLGSVDFILRPACDRT